VNDPFLLLVAIGTNVHLLPDPKGLSTARRIKFTLRHYTALFLAALGFGRPLPTPRSIERALLIPFNFIFSYFQPTSPVVRCFGNPD